MIISRIAIVSDSTDPTSSDMRMAPSSNALGVLKPFGFPTTRLDSCASPESGETPTPPSLTSLLVTWGPYVSTADRITRFKERYRKPNPATIKTGIITPTMTSFLPIVLLPSTRMIVYSHIISSIQMRFPGSISRLRPVGRCRQLALLSGSFGTLPGLPVAALAEAGFSQIRLETKKMKPVSCVCVRGVNRAHPLFLAR